MPISWRCLQPLQRHRSSHDQPDLRSSTGIASETGVAFNAGAEMAFFTGDYLEFALIEPPKVFAPHQVSKATDVPSFVERQRAFGAEASRARRSKPSAAREALLKGRCRAFRVRTGLIIIEAFRSSLATRS